MSKAKEFSGSTPADYMPPKKDEEKPPTIVQTIIWTFMVTALFAMAAITMNYEYRASLTTTQRVLLERIWKTETALNKLEKALYKKGIKVEADDKQNNGH